MPWSRVPRRALALYARLVDALSFSSELYKLRRDLNARIDQPDSSGQAPAARATSRWFRKRRISIAEAYLAVVRDLDSKKSKARLRALRAMVDASLHAKTLDMPLNTARVQMALIKAAVKSRDDHRAQLEALHDFSKASYGQPQVVRRLLDRLGLPELPETGAPLRELGLGYDTHVHDTATSGRKNPTQLLLDAFIKGLSELTIAYNGVHARSLMEEGIEAGRILGIRVRTGIEFSLNAQGERFHYMAVLPPFDHGEELRRFLEARGRLLKPLYAGLEESQERRVEAIRRLVADFNERAVPELNQGFPELKAYRVKRLKMRELAEEIPLASLSREHLGEFLYRRYRPVLFRRVLYLKAQRDKARLDHRARRLSEWDFGIIDERYRRLRAEYRSLSPETLRARFFADAAAADYASAFDDLGRIRRLLDAADCRLRLLHPLEHGAAKAARLLESQRGLLDEIEVYNMRDSVKRDPGEISELCRLVSAEIERARREGARVPEPLIGSDATGRNPAIPGMGFVRGSDLAGRYRTRYLRRRVALPQSVCALLASAEAARRAGGAAGAEAPSAPPPAALRVEGRRRPPRTPDATVYSMGKVSPGIVNRVGDGEDPEPDLVPPARALRYLNPLLVNFLHGLVGFLVAERFVGPYYAALWLGITGFRNAIADLVALRGTRLSQWTLRSVNFDNIARSLFWTGFSVPILGFVKSRFDLVWPLAATGLLYEASKFFFISFSNGLYLASHNKLRGFDRRVIRANIFRSVIAWPFATLSAPLGDAVGIPSIVQAKIWSDVVAGFIEGGNKYLATLRLRRRDLEEIVPRIAEGKREDVVVAVLDLLFLFRAEPRTRNSLKAILGLREGFAPPALPALPAAAAPQAPEAREGEESGTPSGGPESDPEEEARKLEGRRREALLGVLHDEGLDRRLLDYVLRTHHGEVAVDLVSLVSATLPELRSWLDSLRRPHLGRARGAETAT